MSETINYTRGKVYDGDDLAIILNVAVNKNIIDRFNKLDERVKHLYLSYSVQDLMERIFDDENVLGYYVKKAAELPDEKPNTVVIPVVLSTDVYNKYRVRCDDVGQSDVSKQASEDLTDLANGW
jgi:hypothetical protein